MLDLDQLLRHAVEQRASDVHLKVGSRPFVRVDGVLQQTLFEVIEPRDVERVAFAVMPSERAARFRDGFEADFMYAPAGLGRFRVSAFRQRGFIGMVLRRVISSAPGFDALMMPPIVAELADSPSGLVLVAGLAGSGRTSTLAAMVDQVNANHVRHIVTVEDPIEVLHPDKQSLVTQREVGADTSSFHAALLHALRQDPDLVMVSELPDAQTARAAVEAADVGHLVFSSLPTVSAVDTVAQFVELFPPHERSQIRSLLSRALRGIVCQRLLPRAGGRGRVPAVEVMVMNGPIGEAILDGKHFDRIESLMAEGEYYGMQTFDQSLVGLYRRGLIEREAALAHATSAPTLRLELEAADRDRMSGVSLPPPRPSAIASAATPPMAAPTSPPMAPPVGAPLPPPSSPPVETERIPAPTSPAASPLPPLR